jgi:hypothetical protein
MSHKNELRRLVARHLHRPDLRFSLVETEPGSYDAIFPGNRLPPIDYDGLIVALSAKARLNTTGDESGFDSAVFAGEFKGEPVLLFLRAAVLVS